MDKIWAFRFLLLVRLHWWDNHLFLNSCSFYQDIFEYIFLKMFEIHHIFLAHHCWQCYQIVHPYIYPPKILELITKLSNHGRRTLVREETPMVILTELQRSGDPLRRWNKDSKDNLLLELCPGCLTLLGWWWLHAKSSSWQISHGLGDFLKKKLVEVYKLWGMLS